MLQGCKQGGECLIYVVARKIPILSTSFPLQSVTWVYTPRICIPSGIQPFSIFVSVN